MTDPNVTADQIVESLAKSSDPEKAFVEALRQAATIIDVDSKVIDDVAEEVTESITPDEVLDEVERNKKLFAALFGATHDDEKPSLWTRSKARAGRTGRWMSRKSRSGLAKVRNGAHRTKLRMKQYLSEAVDRFSNWLDRHPYLRTALLYTAAAAGLGLLISVIYFFMVFGILAAEYVLIALFF